MADTPSNSNNNTTPGKTLDPVTAYLLGDKAHRIYDEGYTIRPYGKKESYDINAKDLQAIGINSADDPRFDKLHKEAHIEFMRHTNSEMSKPYVSIDDYTIDPVLSNIPTVGPKRQIHLTTHVPELRFHRGARHSEMADVSQDYGIGELGKAYDFAGRSFRTRTNEQVAEATGLYVKKDGSVGSIDDYKLAKAMGMPFRVGEDGKEKVLTLRGSQWVEQEADAVLHKDIIRSAYGPKDERSTAMSTLNASAWNTIMDWGYGGLGSAAEFIEGITKYGNVNSMSVAGKLAEQYGQHFVDKMFGARSSDLLSWANKMQNKAGVWQSKLSQEADASSTFSSHGWAKMIGSAVPQAVGQALAGIITRGVSVQAALAMGLSRSGATKVGNAVAKGFSYGTGASYAMYAMNDEMKKLGIPTQDRWWLMGLAGGATLFAEGVMGNNGASGIADGIFGVKTARHELEQHVKKSAAEAVQVAGKELVEATTDQAKASAGKNLVKTFISALYKYPAMIAAKALPRLQGTAAKQIAHAGVEEGLEEVVEEQINTLTKWGYDTFASDKAQFGVGSPILSLENAAASFVGGLIGGAAAGGLSTAINGVDKPFEVIKGAHHAQIAMSMEQAEGEEMIRKQFAKGWYQDPTINKDGSIDPTGGDVYKAALEGELQSLRLAYAVRQRMGIDDAKIITDVMGGDMSLAAKALQLGVQKEKLSTRVNELRAAVASDPSNKALADDLAQQEKALAATSQQVGSIMDGSLLAKHKVRAFINAASVDASVQGVRSKDNMEKAVQMAREKMGSTWEDKELENTEKVLSVLDGIGKTKLRLASDKQQATQQVTTALDALQAADVDNISLADKYKLLDTLSTLASDSPMTAQQQASWHDVRSKVKRSIESDKDISNDAEEIVDTTRKAWKDAGTLATTDEKYKAREEILVGMGIDTSSGDIEEDHLASDKLLDAGGFSDKLVSHAKAKAANNSMEKAGIDYATSAINDSIVPRSEVQTEMRTKTKLPFINEKDAEGKDTGKPLTIDGIQEAPVGTITDGESVPLSIEGKELIRAILHIGGDNLTSAMVSKLEQVLASGSAAKSDLDQIDTWIDGISNAAKALLTARDLVASSAHGYISDKEMQQLGVDVLLFRRMIEEAQEQERKRASIKSRIEAIKNNKDKKGKIDDVALAAALKEQQDIPTTEMDRMFALLNAQLRLAYIVKHNVMRYADDFPEYNKRQRDTDKAGRMYIASLIVQHQLGGNKDTANSVGINLSSLAAMSKKPEDCTWAEVMEVMEWVYVYFNSKDKDGKIPVMSDALVQAIHGNTKERLAVTGSINTTGQPTMQWEAFTIEHIRGDAAPDRDSDGIALRYRINTMLSMIMGNPATYWQDVRSYVEQTRPDGGLVMENVPGHEQLLTVEHYLAVDNYNRLRAIPEMTARLDDIWHRLLPYGEKESYTRGVGVVLGNAGAGKTSMVLRLILQQQHKHGNIRKVVLVGHKQSLLKPLQDTCSMLGIKDIVSYDTVEAYGGKIDDHDSDTLVIMDELSLVNTEKYNIMDGAAKSYAKKNKGSRVLLLGDILQAQPSFNAGAGVQLHATRWYATVNMSKVYRTGVDGISYLQMEARAILNDETAISALVPQDYRTSAQLISHTPENGGWTGVRRYNDNDEGKQQVVDRLKSNADAIIIVLQAKDRQAWIDAGVPDAQVTCISDDKTTPQGGERSEVFVHFIVPTDYKGKDNNRAFMKFWLTAVSRAKNFVGIIGKGGNNNNVDKADDVPRSVVTRDNMDKRRAGLVEFIGGTIARHRVPTASQNKQQPKIEKQPIKKQEQVKKGKSNKTVESIAIEPLPTTTVHPEDIVRAESEARDEEEKVEKQEEETEIPHVTDTSNDESIEQVEERIVPPINSIVVSERTIYNGAVYRYEGQPYKVVSIGVDDMDLHHVDSGEKRSIPLSDASKLLLQPNSYQDMSEADKVQALQDGRITFSRWYMDRFIPDGMITVSDNTLPIPSGRYNVQLVRGKYIDRDDTEKDAIAVCMTLAGKVYASYVVRVGSDATDNKRYRTDGIAYVYQEELLSLFVRNGVLDYGVSISAEVDNRGRGHAMIPNPYKGNDSTLPLSEAMNAWMDAGWNITSIEQREVLDEQVRRYRTYVILENARTGETKEIEVQPISIGTASATNNVRADMNARLSAELDKLQDAIDGNATIDGLKGLLSQWNSLLRYNRAMVESRKNDSPIWYALYDNTDKTVADMAMLSQEGVDNEAALVIADRVLVQLQQALDNMPSWLLYVPVKTGDVSGAANIQILDSNTSIYNVRGASSVGIGDKADYIVQVSIRSTPPSSSSTAYEDDEDLAYDSVQRGETELDITEQQATAYIESILGMPVARRITFGVLSGSKYGSISRRSDISLYGADEMYSHDAAAHEAGHFVVEFMLPDSERAAVYDEMRQRLGRDATSTDIAEVLADDAMRYEQERRNLRGISKLWRKCIDYLRSVLVNWGIIRKTLNDLWYDTFARKVYRGKPMVREAGLFGEPVLWKDYGAKEQWLALNKTLQDKDTALRIMSSLRSSIGRRILAPSLDSLGTDNIVQALYDNINAATDIAIVQTLGTSTYKNEQGVSPIIRDNVAAASLPVGTYLVAVVDSDNNVVGVRSVDISGMSGNINVVHQYNKNTGKYAPIRVDTNTGRYIMSLYTRNSLFGAYGTINTVRGKTLHEIVAEGKTRSIPVGAQVLLRTWLLLHDKHRVALLGEALPGLPIQQLLDTGRKVSIEDYLNVVQASRDSGSKAESEHTSPVDRQSLFMKLVIQSIPMPDGTMMTEQKANAILLEAATAMGEQGGGVSMNTLQAALDKMRGDASEGQKQYVNALYDYFFDKSRGHAYWIDIRGRMERDKSGTLSEVRALISSSPALSKYAGMNDEQLTEAVLRQSDKSSTQVSAFSVFYGNHYAQQLATIQWSGNADRIAVKTTESKPSSELRLKLQDKIWSEWNGEESVKRMQQTNIYNRRRDGGSGAMVQLHYNTSSGWTLRYNSDAKGGAIDSVQPVLDIATLSTEGRYTMNNAILSTNYNGVVDDVVRYSLMRIGMDVRIGTVKQLMADARRNGTIATLIAEVMRGVMAGRSYAMTDDTSHEAEYAVLQSALDTWMSQYGKGNIDRDAQDDEDDEEEQPYHPAHVYRLQEMIAEVQVYTENGYGRQRGYDVSGDPYFVFQLGHQLNDRLGRGKQSLIATVRADIDKAQEQQQRIISRHHRVVRDGIVHVLNPLLMSNVPAAINEVTYNGGVSKSMFTGELLSDMTESDEWIVSQAHLQKQLYDLKEGNVGNGIMLKLFNQSNRERQPLLVADMRIVLPQAGDSKRSNGILWYGRDDRREDTYTLDLDNIMAWVSRGYARMLKQQSESLRRWVSSIAMLHKEITVDGTIPMPPNADQMEWLSQVVQMSDIVSDDNMRDMSYTEWYKQMQVVKKWLNDGMLSDGKGSGLLASYLDHPVYGIADRYGLLKPSRDYMHISLSGIRGNIAVLGIDANGHGSHNVVVTNADGTTRLVHVKSQAALSLDELHDRRYKTTRLGEVQEQDTTDHVQAPDMTWYKTVLGSTDATVSDYIESGKETRRITNLWGRIANALTRIEGESDKDATSRYQRSIKKILDEYFASNDREWLSHTIDRNGWENAIRAHIKRGDIKGRAMYWLLGSTDDGYGGMLSEYHKANSNVAKRKGGKRKKTAATMDRGIMRDIVQGGKWTSLADLVMGYMDGTHKGMDRGLLKSIIDDLFDGSYKAALRSMKRSGYYTVPHGDGSKTARHINVNDGKNGHLTVAWRGYVIAQQLVNDAAMSLIYGDYGSFTSETQKLTIEDDGTAMMDSVVGVGKRYITGTSPSFSPDTTLYNGIRADGYVLMIHDEKQVHEYAHADGAGIEMERDNVKPSDGTVLLSPLHEILSYHSFGGELGVYNMQGDKKMTSIENNIVSDTMSNLKMAVHPATAMWRLSSPAMHEKFEQMLNPQGMPIVPVELRATVAPTSLYDQWLRLHDDIRAKAVEDKQFLTMQDSYVMADNALAQWYIQQRGIYEAQGIPMPYKHVDYVVYGGSDKTTEKNIYYDSEGYTKTSTIDGRKVSREVLDNEGRVFNNVFDHRRAVADSIDVASLAGMTIEQMLAVAKPIAMERIYNSIDHRQLRFQHSTNKPTDDTSASPITQMMQQYVSMPLPDGSPAAAIVADVLHYYGSILEAGLRDVIHSITGLTTEGMTTRDAVALIDNADMQDKLSTLLAQEMNKSGDTSMLSKIINDPRVGLDFGGAQTRTQQLIAAYLRSRMIKRDMSAQRNDVCGFLGAEVITWYDEQGRKTYIRPDNYERMKARYSLPDPIDIVQQARDMGLRGSDIESYGEYMMEKAIADGQLTGVVYRHRPLEYRVMIDWAKVRDENIDLYREWYASYFDTVYDPVLIAANADKRAAVYKAAHEAGYITSRLAQVSTPNPQQGAYGLHDQFQRHDMLRWDSYDEQGKLVETDIRDTDGSFDSINKLVSDALPIAFANLSYRYDEVNGKRIQTFVFDGAMAQQILERNPMLQSLLGRASRHVGYSIQRMTATEDGQKQLRDLFLKASAEVIDTLVAMDSDPSDTPDIVEKRRTDIRSQYKNNEVWRDMARRIMVRELVNRYLAEGTEVHGSMDQWAEYITRAIMEQSKVDKMLMVRVPSGPGSGVPGEVIWYHNDGSKYYCPGQRFAVTGEDTDADASTCYYTPLTRYDVTGNEQERGITDMQNELLGKIMQLYSMSDSALYLQQPIALDRWKRNAEAGTYDMFDKHIMPGDISNSTRLHQVNVAGDKAIGISANTGKAMMMIYRADQMTRGQIQSDSMTGTDGSDVIPIYWKRGMDFADYPVRVEGTTNMGTDNPKLLYLGKMNATPENIPMLLMAQNQDKMMRMWYAKHGDNKEQADTIDIEEIITELWRGDEMSKATNIVSLRKSLGTPYRGDSDMVAVLYSMLRSYDADNKEQANRIAAFTDGSGTGTEAGKRTDIEMIDDYIEAIQGMLDAGSMMKQYHRDAAGRTIVALITERDRIQEAIDNDQPYSINIPFVSRAMANTGAAGHHKRINAQMERLVAAMGIEDEIGEDDIRARRLTDKMEEVMTADFDTTGMDESQRENYEYMQQLLSDKVGMRDAMWRMYNAMGHLSKRKYQRDYANKVLSPRYYDTISTLYRLAVSAEYVRRVQDIAGLNQGVPSEPYLQRLSIRNIQGITGVSMDKLLSLMDEWEQGQYDASEVGQFLAQRVGTPQQRQANVRDRILAETANKAMQKGNDYLIGTVTVSKIEGGEASMSLADAISKQGDALAMVLVSRDARAFINALMVQHSTNSTWLWSHGTVAAEYQQFLDDMGKDELSRGGYETLRTEWDYALTASWCEYTGANSPQALMLQAIDELIADGMHSEKMMLMGVQSIDGQRVLRQPIDFYTAAGRNRLVVEMADKIQSVMSIMQSSGKLATYDDDVQYLLAEIGVAPDRNGRKRVFMSGARTYDALDIERLSKGFAQLPAGIRHLMELYQLAAHGWEYRNVGPLSKVITTDLHAAYTAYLRNVVYPAVRGNGKLPHLLTSFFEQVKHKTHLSGLHQYGKWSKAMNGYVPPMGKNGYVRYYIEPRVLRNGRKVDMLCELMDSSNLIWGMNGRSNDTITAVNVGLGGDNPLSVSSLMLSSGEYAGYTVEAAARMIRGKREAELLGAEWNPQITGWDGMTEDEKRAAWNAKAATMYSGRWSKPLRAGYDWNDVAAAELDKLYREALMSTTDKDVQQALIDIADADRDGMSTLLIDGSGYGNIAMLLVEWWSNAKAALGDNSLTWDNIREALVKTSTGNVRAGVGRRRYSVPRVSATSMGYSSLSSEVYVYIDEEATERNISMVASEIGIDEDTVRGALQSVLSDYAHGSYTAVYSRLLATLGDKALATLGIDSDRDTDAMYELIVAGSSQWREVDMDGGMLLSHLSALETGRSMTIERKRGHPYHTGDIVHFEDGNVGIITSVGGRPTRRTIRGKQYEGHTTATYTLIRHNGSLRYGDAQSMAQATQWAEALTANTGVQIEWRSDSDMLAQGMGKGAIVKTQYDTSDDVRVVLPDSLRDVGIVVHEWGHLWSALARRRSEDTWQQYMALLRGTEVWDVAKEMVHGASVVSDQQLYAPDAPDSIIAMREEVEYEAMAYLLQYRYYHSMGKSSDDIGLQGVAARMMDAVGEMMARAIGSEAIVEKIVMVDRKVKDDEGKYSNKTIPRQVRGTRVPATATFAQLADALLDAMMTSKKEAYKHYQPFDLLPSMLLTQTGASVRGLTMSNIDRHLLGVLPSTTPAKDVLLRGVMRAKASGDKRYYTPGGTTVHLTHKDGTAKTDDQLSAEVGKLTDDIRGIQHPSIGVHEFLSSVKSMSSGDIYEAARKSGMRGWSGKSNADIVEERTSELRAWMERIGFVPGIDSIVDSKALVSEYKLPDAVVTDDTLVIVKDKGTPMQRYSVLMMTGQGLGSAGSHRGKRINYRTGSSEGVYLDTSNGSMLALQGAVVAMALRQAGHTRVTSVSVSTGQTKDDKVHRHLLSDLLGQVRRVLVDDKAVRDQASGGLDMVLRDGSLLEIEGYMGDVLENLESYAKTMHSRIDTKDQGSKSDSWVSLFVETASKARTEGITSSAADDLVSLVARRLNWIWGVVCNKDKTAIANNGEYQMLADWYRQLRTRSATALTITRMTLDEKWLRDSTRWSNPLQVWVRDSIEAGLHNVRTALSQHVSWIGKQTSDLNSRHKVLSKVWDNAAQLFRPMYKRVKARSKDGSMVYVSIHSLHINADDTDTKAALADPSSGLTLDMVLMAAQVHARMVDELAEYLYHTDSGLGKTSDERRKAAKEKAGKMMADGRIPAMPRRAGAALSEGDYRDALSLWTDNLMNIEAPSESYYDVNATVEEGRLHSTLWKQLDAEHIYGGTERMFMLGLAVDDDGGLVVVDEAKNRNLSYNMLDNYNVAISHSLRARMLRQAAMDARVALDTIRGLQHSGLDTTDLEEVVKVYTDRMLLGKLPMSTSMAGIELDKMLNAGGQAVYMLNLAFAPLVAAKSAVSNASKVLLSSVLNSWSGTGLFGTSSLTRAVSILTSNAAMVEQVNRMMQVVGMSERDMMNHFRHNATQRNMMNKDIGMFMMFYGDYYTKVLGMVAQMVEDGTWDAMSIDNDGNVKYDVTKDKRYYTDGKLTEDGKKLMLDTLQSQQRTGIASKDATTLTMPYDAKEMHRLRAIVERFAGEANDPTAKSHLQAFGLGRAALTLRSYMIGLVQTWYRPKDNEDLLGGKTIDKDGKVVWVGRPVEGIVQTVGAMFKIARDWRNPFSRANITPWQRRNQLLLMMHGAALGLAIYLLEAWLDDDEEKEDSLGEKSLKYVFADGLREQLSVANPIQLYNDVKTKPSALLTVLGNTTTAAWETAMLPYRVFFEEDRLTQGGKISKLDKDTRDYVVGVVEGWIKIVPGISSPYRNGKMLYEDLWIGERGADGEWDKYAYWNE